ncbi:MAG: putative aldolase [Glaciihabitans sp.]|nr:putative aldolase [Glaciihabitans sp.]
MELPTPSDLARLRDIRASSPADIARSFSTRGRRPILAGDKRLLIVAADHPARGALGVGGNPMAMANRYELLQRLALALAHPGVDGVLATPDVLEDLAVLGLLEGKIAVGSMNRGGLRGAMYEMDDRYTAYDIAGIVASGLDFAKILIRINLSDRGSVDTLERTARVVTEAAAAGVPIMLEPFVSRWSIKRLLNDLSTDAVITSIAIASALGSTSAFSWLKLPVVPEMERVMEASTLPTLLLGGELMGAPDAVYDAWVSALALPGVRGLVAGRSVLYPPDNDVVAAVDAVAALVHGDND